MAPGGYTPNPKSNVGKRSVPQPTTLIITHNARALLSVAEPHFCGFVQLLPEVLKHYQSPTRVWFAYSHARTHALARTHTYTRTFKSTVKDLFDILTRIACTPLNTVRPLAKHCKGPPPLLHYVKNGLNGCDSLHNAEAHGKQQDGVLSYLR